MSALKDLPETPFSDDRTLIPAIVQNIRTGKVLMLGYMNRDALKLTQEIGRVTFFSRSKGRLWTKGESSGHGLRVFEIRWDCDQDTLLVLADPDGPTCHTGAESCFDGRTLFRLEGTSPAFETLAQLREVIRSRRSESPDTSYVAQLLTGPWSRLLKKVVEEAGETMAAVYEGGPESVRSEMADLLFHLLVTMERAGVSLEEVLDALEHRSGKSGLIEKRERPTPPPKPEETP